MDLRLVLGVLLFILKFLIPYNNYSTVLFREGNLTWKRNLYLSVFSFFTLKNLIFKYKSLVIALPW